MKYALFMGCKIPYYLEHYGVSTKAVLKALGVKHRELKFNCCGYPNRDISFKAYLLSSARNIAMAEKKKLNILTPCKCCYGSLKHAVHWLNENESLKDEINYELQKEKLRYTGKIKIKHLLSVLHEDVGVDKIKEKIINPQSGKKVAAHYGCHALRPAEIVQFDNPFAPTIFEELIEATGAECVEWPRRLDCCGNPLKGKNDELSIALMENKLSDAKHAGADMVCTACTYCQLQFDGVQAETIKDGDLFPSILYTQLLGLGLGLKEKVIKIGTNTTQK